MSGALSTGLSLWWYAPAAYTQNTGTTGTTIGNYPAASGSNGATPANPTGQTYAAMTTSAVVYDSASVSTGSTGINGKYLVLTMGVDFTFAGGGGAASMGSLQLTYDEQNTVDAFRFDKLDSSHEDRIEAKRLAHLPIAWRRGGSIR